MKPEQQKECIGHWAMSLLLLCHQWHAIREVLSCHSQKKETTETLLGATLVGLSLRLHEHRRETDSPQCKEMFDFAQTSLEIAASYLFGNKQYCGDNLEVDFRDALRRRFDVVFMEKHANDAIRFLAKSPDSELLRIVLSKVIELLCHGEWLLHQRYSA